MRSHPLNYVFSNLSLESQVHAQNPLRLLEAQPEEVLWFNSAQFDQLHVETVLTLITRERMLMANLYFEAIALRS